MAQVCGSRRAAANRAIRVGEAGAGWRQACATVPATPGFRGVSVSYLRILLIMVMSFAVVLIGTIAVVDVERSLAKNDGLWLAVFVLAVFITVAAARLLRRRG